MKYLNRKDWKVRFDSVKSEKRKVLLGGLMRVMRTASESIYVGCNLTAQHFDKRKGRVIVYELKRGVSSGGERGVEQSVRLSGFEKVQAVSAVGQVERDDLMLVLKSIQELVRQKVLKRRIEVIKEVGLGLLNQFERFKRVKGWLMLRNGALLNSEERFLQNRFIEREVIGCLLNFNLLSRYTFRLLRNRCKYTERARSVNRTFHLTRGMFRSWASFAHIFALRRCSW